MPITTTVSPITTTQFPSYLNDDIRHLVNDKNVWAAQHNGNEPFVCINQTSFAMDKKRIYGFFQRKIVALSEF